MGKYIPNSGQARIPQIAHSKALTMKNDKFKIKPSQEAPRVCLCLYVSLLLQKNIYVF